MSVVSPAMGACPIDVTAAGRLVANMLEHALRDHRWHEWPLEDIPHAREDNAAPSPETGLSLSAAVDDGPSPSSSREYRAPVCPEGESLPLGLAGRTGADLGRRFRDFGCRDEAARGLQDLGGRGVDGQRGRGVCAGSLAPLALQYRLASVAGAVCPDGDAHYRRGWLLRSGRLQRPTPARAERDHVPGGAALPARASKGASSIRPRKANCALPSRWGIY